MEAVREKRVMLVVVGWLGVVLIVLGIVGAAVAVRDSALRGGAFNITGERVDPKGIAAVLEKLAQLVDSLSKAPVWIACAVIGIILIVLGSIL